MRRYSVLLIPDTAGSGYTVKVPVLPGLNTEGDTLDDALSNVKEAIELYLEDLQASGEPIPEEAAPAELTTVEV